MSKLFIISFEGGDGSGKTDQATKLCQELQAADFNCSFYREPGGTKAGEKTREMLKDPSYKLCDRAELFYFLGARAQIVSEIILPQLNENKILVFDRFADSSVAYQSFGRDLDRAFVDSNNDFATQMIRPNLTFLLDVDPEIGLKRGKKRGELDRIEQSNLDFHQRLRLGYLKLAQEEPNRFVVINTDEPDWDKIAIEIFCCTMSRIDSQKRKVE